MDNYAIADEDDDAPKKGGHSLRKRARVDYTFEHIDDEVLVPNSTSSTRGRKRKSDANYDSEDFNGADMKRRGASMGADTPSTRRRNPSRKSAEAKAYREHMVEEDDNDVQDTIEVGVSYSDVDESDIHANSLSNPSSPHSEKVPANSEPVATQPEENLRDQQPTIENDTEPTPKIEQGLVEEKVEKSVEDNYEDEENVDQAAQEAVEQVVEQAVADTVEQLADKPTRSIEQSVAPQSSSQIQIVGKQSEEPAQPPPIVEGVNGDTIVSPQHISTTPAPLTNTEQTSPIKIIKQERIDEDQVNDAPTSPSSPPHQDKMVIDTDTGIDTDTYTNPAIVPNQEVPEVEMTDFEQHQEPAAPKEATPAPTHVPALALTLTPTPAASPIPTQEPDHDVPASPKPEPTVESIQPQEATEQKTEQHDVKHDEPDVTPLADEQVEEPVEAAAEEAAAEEAVVEEAVVKEAVVEEAIVEEAVVEEAVVEEAAVEEAAVEEAIVEEIAIEETAAEPAPVPAATEPTPITSLVQPEESSTDIPQEPLQELPILEEKVREEQVTQESPAEEKLVDDRPAEEPLTEEPLTEELLTEEPLAEEDLTEEDLTSHQLPEEPLDEKPQPVEKSTDEKPVALEPSSQEIKISTPPPSDDVLPSTQTSQPGTPSRPQRTLRAPKIPKPQPAPVGRWAHLTPYIEDDYVLYPEKKAGADDEAAGDDQTPEDKETNDMEPMVEDNDDSAEPATLEAPTPALNTPTRGSPVPESMDPTAFNSPAPAGDEPDDAEISESQEPPERKRYFKYRKVRDPEEYLSIIEKYEDMSTADLYEALEAINVSLATWQDEWTGLGKIVDDYENSQRRRAADAKYETRTRNLHQHGVNYEEPDFAVKGYKAKEKEVVNETRYLQSQDRIMAAAYGFEYDPHPSKIGKQNPETQQSGIMTRGRSLRNQPRQTAKATETEEVLGKRQRKTVQLFEPPTQDVSRASTPAPTRGRRRRGANADADETQTNPASSFNADVASDDEGPAVKRRKRGPRGKASNIVEEYVPTPEPEEPPVQEETAKPTRRSRGKPAPRYGEPDPNEFVEREVQRVHEYEQGPYEIKQTGAEQFESKSSHSRQSEPKPRKRHILTLKIPKPLAAAIEDNGDSRPSTADSESSYGTIESSYSFRPKRQKRWRNGSGEESEGQGSPPSKKRLKRTYAVAPAFLAEMENSAPTSVNPTPEPVPAPVNRKVHKIKVVRNPPPESSRNGTPSSTTNIPDEGDEPQKDYKSMTKSEKMSASMKSKFPRPLSCRWASTNIISRPLGKWKHGWSC